MQLSCKHINQLKHVIFGFIVMVFASHNLFGQFNNGVFNSGIVPESIEVEFLQKEITLDKGQIISNVLKIRNYNNDSVNLSVQLNFPPLWKTLFNQDKLYSIPANDSIFIPVRIIPGQLMIGDTKYFINAYIEDENGRQIQSNNFFASTEKISQWDLSVSQGSKIFFKNNESTVNFDVNLVNTGNEKQDIMLTMAKANSNLIVMDSTNKAIDNFKYEFSLDPTADTSLFYKIKYAEGERNFKNVDLENYNPEELSEERQFSIFLHSEEPRRKTYNNVSRDSKVDFIKLSNNKKINPYSSDVLPLSAYLRVTNILDDIVFSSLHLRGQKHLKNGGSLVYNTSMYFSSQENYYSNDYIRNIPWYIGYFDDRKNLQLGYVNGGAIGVQSSGNGIKGEFAITPSNRVGAYYVKAPYIFTEPRIESYGVHHKLDLKNFSNLTQYAHSHNKYANLITDVISITPKIRLHKKHNISFIGALSNRYSYFDFSNKYTRQGYLFGMGYTSNLIKNYWKLNLRGSYTSPGFGSYGYERLFVNHRSRLTVSKNLEITIVNNYNEYKYDSSYYTYIPGVNRNYYLFNSINFFSKKYLSHVTPSLFYDIRNHWGNNFHVRGFKFSFNKYDITKNFQFSLITSFGLSKIMNDEEDENHFVFKLNTMIRVHNLSFTGFYNYGPLTPEMVYKKANTNISPQTLRLSLMHQHLFKQRHFVLQTAASYMYTNLYNHHSLNLGPELYYFTNSGWRFSINPSYTFYSSKLSPSYAEIPSYSYNQEYEYTRTSNDNFMLSVGIKKDFGIPIPTTFDDFNNVEYNAFYDLNGNSIKDDNEPGIENVVIKVGSWRVITKTNGSASMINTEPGAYDFSAFSLSDLKGWFPFISDSLQIFKDEVVNIPFVKGVKIYGSVYVDQEIVNPLEDKKIDLAGIKITATNGKSYNTLTSGDGSFEFYLPFGKYTLSLDENILNGRFYIIKNNYQLDLTGEVDNMFITFHIVEKKRTIRIKKFSSEEE